MAYSPERKAAVLAKMLPPNSIPLNRLAVEEGISRGTLAKWRAKARAKGKLLPEADANVEGWTSRDKLSAVIEASALNEAELGDYCRRRGIFPEQIAIWREACEMANDWDRAAASRLAKETKDDRKRIQQLERELRRKEKALAEAAALLVLRKKAAAIWGPADGEDE